VIDKHCDFASFAVAELHDSDWKYFRDLYSDRGIASSRGYYPGSAIDWNHGPFYRDRVERPERLFRQQMAQRKLLLTELR